MANKNLIELTTKIAGKDRTYTGRFIGFIKDDEFNALIQNSNEVSARLESKETQPIMDIAAKFDNISGHRLMMVVKKTNDTANTKKTLFVSDSLEIISAVIPESKDKGGKVTKGEVTFQSTNQEEIIVQEID